MHTRITGEELHREDGLIRAGLPTPAWTRRRSRRPGASRTAWCPPGHPAPLSNNFLRRPAQQPVIGARAR